MLSLQTQVIAPHPYQSSWPSWPFDIRPIWYLFEVHEGGERGILMLANPATAVLGLIGAAGCTARWWRTHDLRMAVAVGLWLFAWLIFAAIPKSIGFAYYYVPASLMLAIPTAALFHRDDGKHGGLLAIPVITALCGFIAFYPIYAAITMEKGFYERLMWMEKWR